MAENVMVKPTGHWRFGLRRRWFLGALYPEWRFEFDEPLTAPPPGVTVSYLFPDPPYSALPDGDGFKHSSPPETHG